MDQSDRPISPQTRKLAPSNFYNAAIVLTILGDMFYFPWGLGFFVSFLDTGWTGFLALQFAVLFATTLGVLVCGLLMLALPKMHFVWGLLVLGFSSLAIAVDGYILVNIFDSGISGGIIWSTPLALVLIGGILAIIWRPPAPRGNSLSNNQPQTPV